MALQGVEPGGWRGAGRSPRPHRQRRLAGGGGGRLPRDRRRGCVHQAVVPGAGDDADLKTLSLDCEPGSPSDSVGQE